jgi:serine/threonine-protein kinase RsbT
MNALNGDEDKVAIVREEDIILARQHGRKLAEQIGVGGADLTLVATAISEVARNILKYAGKGEVRFSLVEKSGKRGVVVVAHDEGPGIADVKLAMQDGFSTGNSLGLGLPGARRLMDEFHIESALGKGTTVTMTKWASRR